MTRSAYIPHEPVTISFDEPSLTKQSFLDQSDINVIMRQFDKNGLLLHTSQHQGRYGDFVTSQDFHDNMNTVLAARAAFDSLPAKIRKNFDNDPALFLDFVQNPANAAEIKAMGLGEPHILDRSPNDPPEITPQPAEAPPEAPDPALDPS